MQEEEGDLGGDAAVFWHVEKKRQRYGGEDGEGDDEDAGTTVGPLVPDLELVHRRISCTNKAPPSTCAHTLFKSLPHIHS